MYQLEVLNLGDWNCRKYSLVADHNQADGWALRYLPNLKYIELSNVSSNVLQNIGQYCYKLQELHVILFFKMIYNRFIILKTGHFLTVNQYFNATFQINSSSITDGIISWISNCKHLRLVELYENKDVSPVGFAHLLRSNPRLKSLGKCNCIGQVLSTLFDEESIYRRQQTIY